MKRFIGCMLLLGSVSLACAASLADAVKAEVEQQAVTPVCCLPVLERTTKGDLGYCYVSQEGYLAARIEDAALRDQANAHPERYPVCKDPWCAFSKGPDSKRYYRTDERGIVLQRKDRKFEKDHVGLLQDTPALHVAIYGLKWTGDLVPTCSVDVDVNTALLGPLCVMKVAEDDQLSFVAPAQLGQALDALAAGDKTYMLFYKTEGASSVVTGKMPSKYLKALFESKENVPVSACPRGSEDKFEALGFEIVR